MTPILAFALLALIIILVVQSFLRDLLMTPILAFALLALIIIFAVPSFLRDLLFKPFEIAIDKMVYGKTYTFDIQSQFGGDLKRGWRLKSEKRFSEALKIVNSLLGKDPDWAEALLLKAHLLEEAYGNKEASKAVLQKILQMKQDRIKSTYDAAVYFFEELSSSAETKKELPPDG